MLSRRRFIECSCLLGLKHALAKSSPNYRVGITTNTRGGWENDVFLSFKQAHEVGYSNVESFIHYFVDFWETPKELQKKIDDIGVTFVTISNGAPLEMHFEDPSKHEQLYKDHLRLARFNKSLGCKHLKINLGPRRPGNRRQPLYLQPHSDSRKSKRRTPEAHIRRPGLEL